MVDASRARYLASPAARLALDVLTGTVDATDPNRLAATLRRQYPADQAAALGEQLVLRERASARFGHLPLALYTGPGLEMMTHPVVAARRARRLASLGLPVLDLTAGIGGDLAACVAAGLAATGLERDPDTAIILRANVPGAGVVTGDAASPPFRVDQAAVVIDPSRRDGAARRSDPASFSPPFDVAMALLQQARAGVLKAPPGLDHGRIPAWAEMEAVQVGTGLREISLWAGLGARPGRRTAVLLPGGATLHSQLEEAPAETVGPRRYLYDPESCVTRAGLVRHLAHVLGARLMDGQVAYLTSARPAFHPMAATFELIEQVPFGIGRLRDLLRSRRWRPDEIRRRAFPVEPDELRRLLGQLEGDPVTLLCTTLAGKRVAFIVRRLREPVAAPP